MSDAAQSVLLAAFCDEFEKIAAFAPDPDESLLDIATNRKAPWIHPKWERLPGSEASQARRLFKWYRKKPKATVKTATSRSKTKFEKQGGVGWDLYGYHRDPDKTPELAPDVLAKQKQWDKDYKSWSKRLKSEVSATEKRKGFFARLLRRKPKKVSSGVLYKRRRAWQKKNPMPSMKGLPVEGQYASGSRMKTPFDSQTSYKLNAHLDHASMRPELDPYTTDKVYGSTPRVKNLSKKELRKVVKIYKTKAREFDSDADANERAAAKAFAQKAEHLLANPNFKFARLEYE
jgi:hypothetical protein